MRTRNGKRGGLAQRQRLGLIAATVAAAVLAAASLTAASTGAAAPPRPLAKPCPVHNKHCTPIPTTTPPSTTSTPPRTTTPPPSTSTVPSSSSSTTAGYSCIETSFTGRCGSAWDPRGSYVGYPLITGTQGGTNAGGPYVDQNVWSPINGETQTLYANSPGDWKVVNSTPYNPTGSVTGYPNVGAPYNEQPLSAFRSIIGSFTESMPHTAGTSAWATYDNWFDDWSYEVMIQHDFVGNGPCDYVATATFGGSNGVPSQLWGLCKYGSELIWKLAAPGSAVGSHGTVNESSGSVDIKAMIEWLANHGYMAADPTITNLSYGWEICTTGGVPKTFTVSAYSLIAVA
jgi:hypothetical protein